MDLKRIMIVGQPGSGKSTLARQLGLLSGLPVIHTDKIHWCSGWVERTKEEKTRLCIEAERGERWIFEGGHSATWPSRLTRADMLVWLDVGVGKRLWRVVRRAWIGRGRSRADLPEGCPERLRMLPGFIRFIWTTRFSARLRIMKLVESAPPTCRVEHLRSDAEIAAFIGDFS